MNIQFQPQPAQQLPPAVQGVTNVLTPAQSPDSSLGGGNVSTDLAAMLRKNAFVYEAEVQAQQKVQQEQAVAQREASQLRETAAKDEESKLVDPIGPELQGRIDRVPSTAESVGPVERHLDLAREIQSGIDSALASGMRSDHPRIQSARQAMYQQLISAQVKAQSMGLSLEAASKVVESATSGVRTVLQTQT